MDDTPCPYVMSGFYVDPEYQRKGIGSKLFNAFKQQIKGNPFYLRTCSDSKGETFYKKQG
ncbi:hypothetical protein FACS189428_1520 [Clostridia bacterium]|nr:hypothetical protein FACS189428_1520 [Clostridia bacterium]